MKRRVFSAPDIITAEAALSAAVRAGAHPDHTALVAESGIEISQVPDQQKEASPTDFGPAALRGLVGGAVVGLLVGLGGMWIPAVGFTAIGAALTTAVGAVVGGWSAALAGSSVPSAVRRDYQQEIATGHLLLVIDEEDDATLERVSAAAMAAGTLPMKTLRHGFLN